MTDDEETTDALAQTLLAQLDAQGRSITVAESCTGGLLAAHLTDVEGLSHAFERGFVVYCDEAKADMLGVPTQLLDDVGAVSAQCAAAMAAGALERSRADVAVAITGYAGPTDDGGEEGQVFIAAATRDGSTSGEEYRFGKLGRDPVRAAAVREAITITMRCLTDSSVVTGA